MFFGWEQSLKLYVMRSYPTSKKQFEREKLLSARGRELQLLEAGRATEDPRYVIEVAGFLLKRWPGSPDPRRNYRLRAPEDAPPAYFGA
jgi:hypothetical protein